MLFGLAPVAAFATTASGQKASPSGTLAPKRNQRPASVHMSPKLRAIPSRASTKNVVRREKNETSVSVMPRYSAGIATSVMIAFGGSSTTLSSSWSPAVITIGIQVTGVRHWGYDTAHESYDYDGPIYTYGNLLPDQVIVNVRHVLKELGYYIGDVTGSLGLASRQALSAYQRDYGLEVNGAIDEPTVHALGLI